MAFWGSPYHVYTDKCLQIEILIVKSDCDCSCHVPACLLRPQRYWSQGRRQVCKSGGGLGGALETHEICFQYLDQ